MINRLIAIQVTRKRMRFAGIFASTAFCTLVLTVAVSWAQDTEPPGVPENCFLGCKKEYLFLDAYDQNTPEQSITNTFGSPSKIGGDNKHRTERYIGDAVEFYALRAKASKQIVGVGIRTLPKMERMARIPYLSLGEQNDQSNTTNWKFTLQDFTLAYLAKRCEGFVEADARYGFIWSPACYFGRPGRYMYYSFLFDREACNFPMEKIAFDRVSCKNPAQVRPSMVFVSANEDGLQRLAHYLSGLLYWSE